MSSHLLESLNPNQRLAVTTTEGPLLVLAGAGTGKTKTVTVRIAYMLDHSVEAENILAVTFTNKAAREMHERVMGIVGRQGKNLTVSTFHSFAVRLLRKNLERLGWRPNFTIADEEDQHSLLRDSLRGLGISEKVLPLRVVAAQIADWKNDCLDAPRALEAARDDQGVTIAHVYSRLAEEMKRRNVVDFEDMILLAVKLLESDVEVRFRLRERFRYLMVDEYQDTNAAQYQLIRLLAGDRKNLCVVGDDDQSIYGWRGARARNILDFAKDYRGAKVVTLDQNYRSVNTILKAANSVIQNNPERKPKQLWSALGEGEPVGLYKAEDEKDEEVFLTTRISELLRQRTPPKDVAVLFRSNAHAQALEVAFRQRKIPYKVVGTRSFFDRREVRDLVAYLKVIANPRDDGALFRVINTPPRGIGKSTQDALVEAAVAARLGVYELIAAGPLPPALSERAREAVEAFKGLMADTAERARTRIADALRHLIERIGYRAHLDMEYRESGDAELRWNVVESLLRVAENGDRSPAADRLQGFLESLALDKDKNDDKDDDSSGIWLLTCHAAKGLEFENVFIFAVEDDVFPHKNSFDEETGTDTIDEERRLFYVAITRAKRRLTMTMASKRPRYGRYEEKKASRFIAEIDEAVLKIVEGAKAGPAEEAVAQDFLSRLKSLTQAKKVDEAAE